MKIENQTPLQAAWLVLFDKQGAERMVVTMKATYLISADSQLARAPEPDPLRGPDEFHGEPGLSSIRYEGELGPPKPATDVALLGSAVAREPGTTREMDVLVRVGPLRKHLRVFGNRQYGGMLGFSTISEPEAFDRIPLIYENAFGGKDTSAKDPKRHEQEARNPVGRGFVAKHSELKVAGMALPNIEDPEQALSRPGKRVTPQGVGFIGRDWQPRVSYAGTYDQSWMEERMPLLPLNFDERYHNAAHPDLTANGFLDGNEPVEVIGCTLGGRVAFNLPGLQPQADVISKRGREPVGLKLNTVLVDTEAMKLHLLWKGDLNVHRRLLQLIQVECRLCP
ncbi:MAG TPA: DUF2169 domain-containing protein [Methylomirabilota bacterium]|nr:DUF2169 domain-containing protein [Methylomirabilota bacterium]